MPVPGELQALYQMYQQELYVSSYSDPGPLSDRSPRPMGSGTPFPQEKLPPIPTPTRKTRAASLEHGNTFLEVFRQVGRPMSGLQ